MNTLPEIMQLKIAGLVNENAMLKRKLRVYQAIVTVIKYQDKFATPDAFRDELEYQMQFLDDLEREERFLNGEAGE